ncbi:MAG: transcriptional regulator [Deltaproteobacteria bacterium]|nr:transcriptional regulator [Deltaproteobacteria bacterium]
MKILILLLIGYLAYRSLKSWMLKGTQQHSMTGNAAGEINDEMVKDPYCEVYFAKRDGVLLRHQGEDLYFCSEACRDKFIEQ